MLFVVLLVNLENTVLLTYHLMMLADIGAENKELGDVRIEHSRRGSPRSSQAGVRALPGCLRPPRERAHPGHAHFPRGDGRQIVGRPQGAIEAPQSAEFPEQVRGFVSILRETRQNTIQNT